MDTEIRISTHPGTRPDNTVYLRVEIDGRDYLGTLLFDDFGFYYEIYSLLKSCVGCSIQEIANTDLS